MRQAYKTAKKRRNKQDSPFSLLPFHADDLLKAFEGLLWLPFQ